MTEASVSFAGNLTDDPEVRYTEGGDAPGHVPGGRQRSAGPGGVVLHRGRVAGPGRACRRVLSKGSRVVVVGRLQQRARTAEDGSARSVVEVVAEELGPSLRWATATTTRTTRSQEQASTA
jgi:single-strand DNA-binding protein